MSRLFCVLQPKKKKNINHDVFGTKLGRIHMESQDLKNLQTRKVKALKRQAADGEDGEKEQKKKPKKDTTTAEWNMTLTLTTDVVSLLRLTAQGF